MWMCTGVEFLYIVRGQIVWNFLQLVLNEIHSGEKKKDMNINIRTVFCLGELT